MRLHGFDLADRSTGSHGSFALLLAAGMVSSSLLVQLGIRCFVVAVVVVVVVVVMVVVMVVDVWG